MNGRARCRRAGWPMARRRRHRPARQARRPDFQRGPATRAPRVSGRARRATPGASIRSRAACCRSASARPPRRVGSCSMPTRPIGARRARRAHGDRRPRGRNDRNGARPGIHQACCVRVASRFLGRVDAGAADVFGAEARGPAAVSACAAGASRSSGPARQISIRRLEILAVGADWARLRGRLQQGHLCPQPCRRPCARLRNGRTCGKLASPRAWAVQRPADAHARRDRGSRSGRVTASNRCCSPWMRPCRDSLPSSSGSQSRPPSCRAEPSLPSDRAPPRCAFTGSGAAFWASGA